MTQEEREKWFRDNQWLIDAIRDGCEVEMRSAIRPWKRTVPTGFDIDDEAGMYRDRFCTYIDARPAPARQRRYLGPVDMMRWLVEHGYKPNYGGGWTCYGSYPFSPAMWRYCDTPVVEDDHGYSYHSEWIEEVNK